MKGKWFAAYWDWQLRSEHPQVRKMREEVVGAARGRVLEIGCGPGANFAYYGDAASEVIATDPNPFMLPRAMKRAADMARRIEIREARAEKLPFEDGTFDTVVSTFNMCSVEDVAAAFAEIKRVLKSDGEYRFADHVRYEHAFGAFWQDLATPVWSRLLNAGCRPNRDIARSMREAGFDFLELQRLTPFWPVPPIGLLRPNIKGSARAA